MESILWTMQSVDSAPDNSACMSTKKFDKQKTKRSSPSAKIFLLLARTSKIFVVALCACGTCGPFHGRFFLRGYFRSDGKIVSARLRGGGSGRQRARALITLRIESEPQRDLMSGKWLRPAGLVQRRTGKNKETAPLTYGAAVSSFKVSH